MQDIRLCGGYHGQVAIQPGNVGICSIRVEMFGQAYLLIEKQVAMDGCAKATGERATSRKRRPILRAAGAFDAQS